MKHIEYHQKFAKQLFFVSKWGKKVSNEFPRWLWLKTRGFGACLKVSAQTNNYPVQNRQKRSKIVFKAVKVVGFWYSCVLTVISCNNFDGVYHSWQGERNSRRQQASLSKKCTGVNGRHWPKKARASRASPLPNLSSRASPLPKSKWRI